MKIFVKTNEREFTLIDSSSPLRMFGPYQESIDVVRLPGAQRPILWSQNTQPLGYSGKLVSLRIVAESGDTLTFNGKKVPTVNMKRQLTGFDINDQRKRQRIVK